MRSPILMVMMAVSLWVPAGHAAPACTTTAPLPALPTSLPAMELLPPSVSAPACVTAANFAARMREIAAAASRPVPAPAAVPTPATPATAGGYVPKTKDDNTPWRFDMNQNGRRMTAEEFDAWMKAKGIRVATGKPAGTDAAAPPPANGATTTCQPSATVTC